MPKILSETEIKKPYSEIRMTTVSAYCLKIRWELVQLLMRFNSEFPDGQSGQLRNLGFTNQQFNDFQKLKYWNLVEKMPGSKWRISILGHAFLGGRHLIPVYIQKMDNKVTAVSESKMSIIDVRHEYESKQKYQQQKRGSNAETTDNGF